MNLDTQFSVPDMLSIIASANYSAAKQEHTNANNNSIFNTHETSEKELPFKVEFEIIMCIFANLTWRIF